MYERFFGLSERPFELTSNPKYLFFTPQHREALANLEYGLASAKAITVVIGEAGLGKTTLLRAALQSEQCRQVRAVVLDNPTMSRAEPSLATRLAGARRRRPRRLLSAERTGGARAKDHRAHRRRGADLARAAGRSILANIETPARIAPALVGQPSWPSNSTASIRQRRAPRAGAKSRR
jgi:predicted ATPase